MRKHLKALSMGNGEKSELEMYRLVDRLREAFRTHSGLQQGQSHISYLDMANGKFEIKDTVMDIATALGVNVKIIEDERNTK